MRILSIQVTSEIKKMTFKEKEWPTAIYKTGVPGPVFLDRLGLDGDRQANLNVHGGEGRAVYAFGKSTYQLWTTVISADLLNTPGLFGENLTLDSIDEENIYVGDRFKLGTTILEATMPRFPCFIFAERVGYDKAQEFMYKTKKPGVLFRVIQTGTIQEGDQLELAERSKYDLTMTRFLELGHVSNLTSEVMSYLKTITPIPQITIDRLEYRLIHGR